MIFCIKWPALTDKACSPDTPHIVNNWCCQSLWIFAKCSVKHAGVLFSHFFYRLLQYLLKILPSSKSLKIIAHLRFFNRVICEIEIINLIGRTCQVSFSNYWVFFIPLMPFWKYLKLMTKFLKYLHQFFFQKTFHFGFSKASYSIHIPQNDLPYWYQLHATCAGFFESIK